MNKKGRLHIVGTPIGNMGDITFRAIETLKAVDLVACEDTRRTLGLLTHFGIKKPLVSYYKPKEREGARRVLASLERGDEVALVTDAGMPCISDPGALLVKEARDEGFEVTAEPGPTAVATAMALSGILEPVFVFAGFERNFGARVCIRRFFAPEEKGRRGAFDKVRQRKGDDRAVQFAPLDQ